MNTEDDRAPPLPGRRRQHARTADAVRCAFVRMFACVLLMLSPMAHALDLVLLAPGDKGPAQQFVEALRKATKPGVHRVREVTALDEVARDGALERTDVVIAAGRQAVEAALRQSDRPVFAVLVGQRDVERFRREFPQRSLGAIVLDQPVARHLALVRTILPQASQLGVLLGPDSRFVEPMINQAATAQQLALDIVGIADSTELVGALQVLLERNAALLPLPDSLVSSPAAARAILLTSYRHRRPVFAFSSAYVSAGALAAVFSSPEHIAYDLADLLNAGLHSAEGLGGIHHPERFEVEVNRTVAKALGITVPDEQILRERIAGGGARR